MSKPPLCFCGRWIYITPQQRGVQSCKCESLPLLTGWNYWHVFVWVTLLEEFKHEAGRISEQEGLNVSHLEQYLVRDMQRTEQFFLIKWPQSMRVLWGCCAEKCGSTLRSQDHIYGLCACVWARLKFCERSIPMQLWDSRITSWEVKPVTYSSVMGSISARPLCSPLIVHRCSARLCVPQLVAAGFAQTPHTLFRLYCRGGNVAWSKCLIWLLVLVTGFSY